MLRVFVDVMAPAFLVVGAGILIARTVGIKPQALVTLAYWVLGPAFIFDTLSKSDLDGELVGKVVAVTAMTMVVVGSLGALISWASRSGYSVGAASVLTSVHGNAGNLGLAISSFALGAAVLPIAAIFMVTNSFFGILTGIGLANAKNGRIGKAALIAFTSPLTLAVIPAIPVNAYDLALPLWLDRPISLLAAAMIPVMLLTLGIQIAGMERTLPRLRVAVPIGLKLLVAPAVAFGATMLVALDGTGAEVVVLQSAMPAAVFTSIVALEHDLEPDFVTSVVLVGTLVSILTIPIVISLL